MKKLLAMLSVLMLFVALSVTASAADAGGDLVTAKPIEVNKQYTDNINNQYDMDYYKFTLSKAGSVSINVQHENLYNANQFWYFRLFNSNNELITVYSVSGTDTDFKSYSIGLDKGTYFLEVSGGVYYNDAGQRYYNCDYKLTVKYSESSAWEKEFNQTFATANAITVNKAYSGSIIDNYDHDMYRFKLEKPGTVNFFMVHPNFHDSAEYYTVRIYNDKTELLFETGISGTATSTKSALIGLNKGTYFVEVVGGHYTSDSAHCYNHETYQFKLIYNETNYSEKENNEKYATATSMALAKPYIGSINDRYDIDYYKITVPTEITVALKFTHKIIKDANEYYVIKLFDSKTNELHSESIAGTKTETKITKKLSKGTYYIRITGGRYNFDRASCFSTSDYTITAGVSVPKVSNFKAVGKSTSAIKLAWSAASGVTGYKLQQLNGKEWKTVKTLSAKTTSSIVSGLKSGQKYSFRICAYKTVNEKNYYSSFSGTVVVSTTKPTLTVKAAKISTSAISLSCTKVSGAKYYKFERTADGKNWTTLTTTTSTSYTAKNLKVGTKYYFRVTALNSSKKKIGQTSPLLKTATLTAAPSITLKTSKSKTATVSWKKVSGASNYMVYKSTDCKKWTKAGTTTKTAFTLTKLAGGKKIYVKVYANNAYTKHSAASAVKSVTVKK